MQRLVALASLFRIQHRLALTDSWSSSVDGAALPTAVDRSRFPAHQCSSDSSNPLKPAGGWPATTSSDCRSLLISSVARPTSSFSLHSSCGRCRVSYNSSVAPDEIGTRNTSVKKMSSLSTSPLNIYNFRAIMGRLATMALGSLSSHDVPFNVSNSTMLQNSSSDIRLKSLPFVMPSLVIGRMLPVLHNHSRLESTSRLLGKSWPPK